MSVGKRGPKPKSAAEQKLRGNPSKRPLTAGKPGPPAARPKCPAFLGKVARAKWRSLVPELEQLGVLAAIDGDVLACYCQAWAEFVAATMALEDPKTGRLCIRGTGAAAAHPAVAMQRSAWKAVKDFASLLGLHLGARRGLGLDVDAEPEADELEKHLGAT